MLESSEGEEEHKLKPAPYQTIAEDDPSAPLCAELLCISWTILHYTVSGQAKHTFLYHD